MSSTRPKPEHRRPGRADQPPQLDPRAVRIRAKLRATEAGGGRAIVRELASLLTAPQRRT